MQQLQPSPFVCHLFAWLVFVHSNFMAVDTCRSREIVLPQGWLVCAILTTVTQLKIHLRVFASKFSQPPAADFNLPTGPRAPRGCSAQTNPDSIRRRALNPDPRAPAPPESGDWGIVTKTLTSHALVFLFLHASVADFILSPPHRT
jgi:hypothetical protein